MRTMPNTHAKNRTRSTRRRRGPRSLLLAATAAVALLLALAVASASASSSIEGVWAFESGQIAIESQNGKLEGVVVQQTKFKECVHQVEQHIWTELTPQPDGSYWGKHQWYFEGCEINPELGRAAFRVLEGSDGSKYLLVCLSYPGSSEPQPTIAANGTSEHATYGCIKSTLTSSLPTTSTSTTTTKTAGEVERLSLPSAKKCLSARLFNIHLTEPKYDPFKTVVVTVKGRKVKTVRHGSYVVATINLKNFKKGKFTVAIHVTTVLGHHLSSTRTYHTCAKKAKHSKPGKLH
jgi:hypothetical protein